MGAGVAGAGAVVDGGVVVVEVVDGNAWLMRWSRCCLLTVTPVAAELMSVALASGGAGASRRLVWYSLPGPALDPMVMMRVVCLPLESVRCSWLMRLRLGSGASATSLKLTLES